MARSNPQTVVLSGDGARTIELPLLEGSMGPQVVDVRKLYARTGWFTYVRATPPRRVARRDHLHRRRRRHPAPSRLFDPWRSGHSERLPRGGLPDPVRGSDREQKAKFVHGVTYHTMLHEQIMYLLRGFRRDAHPMAVMIAGGRLCRLLP